MPAQLSLSSTIKNLLVCVVTVASLAFFLAPCAKATTWTITVKPAAKNTLTYDVSPAVGGCPFPVTQDPKNLRICDGDIVQWQAMFPVAHPTKTNLKMWIFHEDFILRDEDGDPALGFHAVNADTTTGGMTDSTATWGVPHKYHVSVFDRSTGNRYHDDPTIIIGGTHVEDFVDFVKKVCVQLSSQIEKDKDLDEKTKELVRDGCKQFQDIKKPLN